MPPVVNYNFMTSSSKTSLVGEGGMRGTQNGCWEMAAGTKLCYCMRRKSGGCLFSIYSALHHLPSANPLAAVRTTDHAISLTSSWITVKYVCVYVFEREGQRERGWCLSPPSETLLNIHWQLFRFDQGVGWYYCRERGPERESVRLRDRLSEW